MFQINLSLAKVYPKCLFNSKYQVLHPKYENCLHCIFAANSKIKALQKMIYCLVNICFFMSSL